MNAVGSGGMGTHHVVQDNMAPTGSSAKGSARVRRILRSRLFAGAVTAGVLLVGYLIARKLGVGSGTLTTIGVVALVLGSHFFLHGAHGGHAGHGGQGGARRTQDPRDGEEASTEGAEDREDRERPSSPRGSAGCH